MIRAKQVYEESARDDGFRVLVDRLWPRGLTKEKANVDLWLKDIAPSNKLRQWFSHDQSKWIEFKKRYLIELEDKTDLVKILNNKAQKRMVTLVYGAKNKQYNNAVALKEYLEN